MCLSGEFEIDAGAAVSLVVLNVREHVRLAAALRPRGLRP